MNVFIGGLPQYTREHNYLTSSTSYYSDDFTWCVQRAHFLPFAISLFRIATPIVWVTLFGHWFLHGVILFYVIPLDSMLDHGKIDFFKSLIIISASALYGISARFNPQRMSLRLYYAILLLFGMAYFQLFLYNCTIFVTKRFRDDPVDTIAGLVDGGFRFAGTATILEHMQEQQLLVSVEKKIVQIPNRDIFTKYLQFQYPPDSLESFHLCNDIDECLIRLMHDNNNDLAVGVSRAHVTQTSLYVNHQIFCFDRSQNIMNYTISLAIRNDYELISNINKLIRRVLEGGLTSKWHRENTKNILPEVEETFRYETIRVEHFLTLMYYVTIPSFFLSTAIFTFERLVVSKIRRAKTAKNRKFWMKLSKIVDGRRHVFNLKSK